MYPHVEFVIMEAVRLSKQILIMSQTMGDFTLASQVNSVKVKSSFILISKRLQHEYFISSGAWWHAVD